MERQILDTQPSALTINLEPQVNPQLRSLTNLGLAYSRLYLNDAAAAAYEAATAHPDR